MTMADMYNRSVRRKIDRLMGRVAVTRPILQRLGLAGLIDEKVGYPQSRVSPGTTLEILILNRLHAPRPMVQVEKWAQEETCVGTIYGISPGLLNDDRLGRSMDTVHPQRQVIWDEAVTKAMTEYELEMGWHTTT